MALTGYHTGMGPNPPFALNSGEIQVLLGSLLGDGSIPAPPVLPPGRHHNCWFSEGHCIAQEAYLRWKATQLRRLGPQVRTRPGRSSNVISLRTRRWPMLTELRGIFYPQGKKIVPKDKIWELGLEGLAVWWMDDGSYHQQHRNGRLCTQGFTKEDNRWLAEHFFPKQFGLEPRVTPVRRRIKGVVSGGFNFYLWFSKGETKKLVELLKSLIHPTLRYKLGFAT